MRFRWISIAIAVGIIISTFPAAAGQAQDWGIENFERTWARTDLPVAAGRIQRTWMWGPEGHTEAFIEPYEDAPGGERLVQYTDKSRMEDNSYRADQPWDVTNGLLAKELLTGRVQVGDDEYEEHQPADIHVAGDPVPDSPTYAMFGETMDEPAVEEGDSIIARMSSDGTFSDNEYNQDDPSDRLTAARGVTAAHYVEETDHTVASVFWNFLNSSGEVYEDGSYHEAQLFPNPFFATGFPITEAYWMNVPVDGEDREVLAQCFERRCLTYTPESREGWPSEEWEIEAGNIGQHYFEWRYGDPNDHALNSGAWEWEVDFSDETFDPAYRWWLDEDISLAIMTCDGLLAPWSGSFQYDFSVTGDFDRSGATSSGTVSGSIDEIFPRLFPINPVEADTFRVDGERSGTNADDEPWGPEPINDERVQYLFEVYWHDGEWNAEVSLEVVYEGQAPFPLWKRTIDGELSQAGSCE